MKAPLQRKEENDEALSTTVIFDTDAVLPRVVSKIKTGIIDLKEGQSLLIDHGNDTRWITPAGIAVHCAWNDWSRLASNLPSEEAVKLIHKTTKILLNAEGRVKRLLGEDAKPADYNAEVAHANEIFARDLLIKGFVLVEYDTRDAYITCVGDEPYERAKEILKGLSFHQRMIWRRLIPSQPIKNKALDEQIRL